MKSVKITLLAILGMSLYIAPSFALLGDDVDLRKVGNMNVPAPEDIANMQLYSNKEIEYMIQHYSTPELAKIAIQLNRAQTAIAKKNRQIPPARLTKEILTNKEKIADYLRSQYKFSY